MRLFSDEYMTLTNQMFECLKMACKYDLNSARRLYWENKAAEYKAARKALKDAGKA